MRQLAEGVDYETRMWLMRNGTVAIGWTEDQDGHPRDVYTVNNNTTNQSLRDAADRLHLDRWTPNPRATGRGHVGAPTDAEQLLLEGEDAYNSTLYAMVVSRGLCVDCTDAVDNKDGEKIPAIVERIAPTGADIEIQKKLSKIQDLYDRVKNEIDRMEGDHKAQKDLYDHNIFGFWTNRLFNKEPPELIIWVRPIPYLAAARRAIRQGQPASALRAVLQARRALTICARQYLTWREGIDGAGTKMQIAIGVVAAAAVIAFVAPTVLGAGAVEGSAEASQVVRIAEIVENADQVLARVETISSEAELMHEAALEVEMEMFQLLGPL